MGKLSEWDFLITQVMDKLFFRAAVTGTWEDVLGVTEKGVLVAERSDEELLFIERERMAEKAKHAIIDTFDYGRADTFFAVEKADENSFLQSRVAELYDSVAETEAAPEAPIWTEIRKIESVTVPSAAEKRLPGEMEGMEEADVYVPGESRVRQIVAGTQKSDESKRNDIRVEIVKTDNTRSSIDMEETMDFLTRRLWEVMNKSADGLYL